MLEVISKNCAGHNNGADVEQHSFLYGVSGRVMWWYMASSGDLQNFKNKYVISTETIEIDFFIR